MKPYIRSLLLTVVLSLITFAQAPAQTVSAPAIALSPTALAFDSVRVGPSSRQTLTISNTGGDSLRVTRVAVAGPDSVHFSATPTAFVVPPGKNQAVTVTFAPGSAGKKSAFLSIAHNAAGSPALVVLTGIGFTRAQTKADSTELQDISRLYTYAAEVGRVRVFSNISVAFSQEHAAHASLVWNYFSGLFVRSRGSRTEMYYTMDINLYNQVFKLCPSIVIPGARQLTSCYDPGEGISRWFVVPYRVPDFGTQQHELSHSFLNATYPASEDFPWIKEGTGMYWESGSFDGAGNLVVTTPIAYLTRNFHKWYSAGQLLPLTALVLLPRAQFYTSEPTLVYSQAGMFIFYLMQNYPTVMTDLFGRLNSRSLTNNDQVLAFLTGQTGLSLQQLDAAYVAFSLNVFSLNVFSGITFDAPFPATITAGLPIRLSGNVTDQTVTQILVGLVPTRGDTLRFYLDVQGGRFSQDIVLAPEQAGTYTMSIFLGQKGQGLSYADGFSPVTVKAVPGIKATIPVGYFPGLALDAPFSADVFVGKAVKFSGSVTNPTHTQVIVEFRALDGGQNVPASFIDVNNGRFSKDFSFTQTGRYSMLVWVGVRGQSVFAGQFVGIRVRQGQPDLALTVPRLDFGEVAAGGSKDQTLLLYNRGTQTLTIKDITASPSALSAAPRTASVAAGDSVRITVTFRPAAAGDLAGTLTVSSDDPDEGTLSVSVVGRSLSRAGGPPSTDFDGDGEVGFSDFFLFASAFGQKAAGDNAKFDLDSDGEVGFGDFFVFAAAFGQKR